MHVKKRVNSTTVLCIEKKRIDTAIVVYKILSVITNFNFHVNVNINSSQ